MSSVQVIISILRRPEDFNVTVQLLQHHMDMKQVDILSEL